jgi:hypothetical protein
MPIPEPPVHPIGNFQTFQHVPSKVNRRVAISRPVFKRRTCQDNRAYVTVPFTFTNPLTVRDGAPMWRADRHYWIARVTANVGLHVEGTHPNDGTPSGQSIKANMMRVKGTDLSTVTGILVSNARLNIPINQHQDAINDENDGAASEGDFAVKILQEGDHIFPRISQVGSGRPGTTMVVSIVMVPIP